MSEKPILFSGEMVRGILDDRKTNTRRIVTRNNSTVLGDTRRENWDELLWHGEEYVDDSLATIGMPRNQYLHVPAICDGDEVRYRVGSRIAPGDTLWVREPATLIADYRGTGYASGVVPDRVKVRYEADGKVSDWIEYPTRLATLEVGHRIANGCYREACRLRLKVTGVRVERLQDISQEDAIAEGSPRSHSSIDGVSRNFGFPDFSRSWFAQLWQSINGPESWAENPWVWVYEFERKEEVLG